MTFEHNPADEDPLTKHSATEISFYQMVDGKLPLCGCGKLARYYVEGNRHSCNKHFRCPTYEEQKEGLVATNKELLKLRSAINKLRLLKGWWFNVGVADKPYIQKSYIEAILAELDNAST